MFSELTEYAIKEYSDNIINYLSGTFLKLYESDIKKYINDVARDLANNLELIDHIINCYFGVFLVCFSQICVYSLSFNRNIPL